MRRSPAVRPTSIDGWYGLNDATVNNLRRQGIDWDILPKNKILIAGDITPPSPTAFNDAPPREAWSTNANSYEVTGVSGGDVMNRMWRDKPIRGAMQGDGRF